MNKPILANQDMEYTNVKINVEKKTRALIAVCAFGLTLIAVTLLCFLVVFVSNNSNYRRDNQVETVIPTPVQGLVAMNNTSVNKCVVYCQGACAGFCCQAYYPYCDKTCGYCCCHN